MNSLIALLVLMGLILGLSLGLRRTTALSDQGEGVAAEKTLVVSSCDSRDPGPSGPGPRPGGSTGFFGFRVFRSSPSISTIPARKNPPAGDSASGQESLDGESWPLESMIQALETASTHDELGLWADRIAVHGGSAAVEALIRLSLSQNEPARAEVIREALKGLSTEEDMLALVERLPQVEPPELIEAVVETLARGARASTLQGLARLHDGDAMPGSRRWVLAWAIERVRNPEASIALVELTRNAQQPELADAAIIAEASLQIEAGSPAPEVSP